ncbi:MAG: hypothetical protein JWO31_2725 [Phycisphaerales bacterium]|nr:hypothetical protein [Phycisphaerales bacterium]
MVPATAPATSPAVTVVETKLYSIPSDGTKLTDTVASPDNLHVAVVESKDGSHKVVVDGTAGPAHEWVVRQSLGFAAAGGRFAYQVQQGATMHAATGTAGPPQGDKAGPATAATNAATAPAPGVRWDPLGPGFYVVGRMMFSPDGRRFAYAAQRAKDGPTVVEVDGAEHPPAAEVFTADMQFSPDGKRFVYRVREAGGGTPPAASQPGQAPATGPTSAGRQRYVLDGVPQPAYDAVGRFTFSPDGSRFGYVARSGTQTTMVIDGKETARHAAVAGLTFSADGKRYAYAVEQADAAGKLGGKQALVANDGAGEKQYQSFDGLGAIAFSPDGRRVAITTQAGKAWTVVLDGKPAGAYDGTGGLMFSPDSKRLAVVAGRGRQQFVAVDGKEDPPADLIVSAAFSPDSARVAAVVVANGQRWLTADGVRIGPGTTFAFAPTGRRVAHALPAPGGRTYTIALDGQPASPEYDASPPGARLVWESPTTVRTIAGRGKDLFLVRLKVGSRQ